MDTASPKSRKIIASVQRALDILNLFEGSRAELGNGEIARLLDLDPGTASGLIATLKVNGYLDQNPINRKYRLGLKLVERASALVDQLDLRKLAAIHLEELRSWCDESINLAIRDGQEVVYIERFFGGHALGIRSELGKRAPVHSTALGKAILAFSPRQEIQNFIDRCNFNPVTGNTITDPDQFLQELERVRKTGYAIDEEENEIGGRCVSAPVFGFEGVPVAAVSISVPIQRLPREKVPIFGQKVMDVACAISRSVGFHPKE
jgi:IclR family transcriptional regulator, KDG regulon repressor